MEIFLIISIISLIILILGLFIIFRFLKQNINKENNNTNNINTDINDIKEKQIALQTSLKEKQTYQISEIKSVFNLIKELKTTNEIETKNLSKTTENLSKEIKKINNVFSSNYKRGELGEIALKWVLDNCFSENQDIVIPQYTMKNNNRPDYFLKTNNGGIPIDSKFPFDNFLKIIELKESTDEYKKQVQLLKQHLKKHISDLSNKYISKVDKTELVFLYLPSEALFSFVYSKKDFENIRIFADKNKVIFTSSSTLPATLKLVALFERDKRLQKNLGKILSSLDNIYKETNNLQVRWDIINKKLNILTKDSNNFDITVNKLTKNIKNTIDTKIDKEQLKLENSNKN